MRALMMAGVSACLLWMGHTMTGGPNVSKAGVKEETQIAHIVYFTLNDNSQTAKGALVTACRKHLTKHPGEVFFRAGTRGAEFKRAVNDLDFDVALHIVFENTAAYDRYESAPRHKQFIEENKANWKKVRVFDSVVIAEK